MHSLYSVSACDIVEYVQAILTLYISFQGPSLKNSITKARIALKNLETLTYNFQEYNDKHAQDLAQHLEELYTQYYEYLPNKDGLVIRPRCQVALQNTRRKLHRRRVSLKCSALLKPKKAKVAKLHLSRVGIKADRVREVHCFMVVY